MREDVREDVRKYTRNNEFPPLSDNASSHSIIVRITENGALDFRVRDGDLAPQLLEQAVVAARSVSAAAAEACALDAKSRALEAKSRALDAKSRALEAKSRAIRNIVVPVLAVAAFAFMALRPRP